MIELMLPMPPPLSKLTNNIPGRGRVQSKEYKLWIARAGREILCQRGTMQPGIAGDVRVFYSFGPRCRKSDVFNREKAISDLLVKHKIIQDDRFIVRGTVAWADVEGCRVEIWPA